MVALVHSIRGNRERVTWKLAKAHDDPSTPSSSSIHQVSLRKVCLDYQPENIRAKLPYHKRRTISVQSINFVARGSDMEASIITGSTRRLARLPTYPANPPLRTSPPIPQTGFAVS